MKVSPINNQQKPNFQKISIICPENWRPKRLEKFASNEEVKKLVTALHKRGIDVYANEGVRVPVNIYENYTEVFRHNRLVCKIKDFDTFNADKALAHYDKMVAEDAENEAIIKKSLEKIKNFNEGLV